MDNMFDYKQRANTDRFRRGHGQTFSNETKAQCPHCNTFVNKEDKTCWACKKDLNPSQRAFPFK